MQGLMMDMPLLISTILQHAARHHGDTQIVSRRVEVTSTDYIDPYSAGFEISSSAPSEINASGGTFIFLAIA